jgi:hypothetical protein
VFTIFTAVEAHEREQEHPWPADRRERGERRARGEARFDDQPKPPRARALVFNDSAPTDPRDTAMKKANPASWISRAYLARQAASRKARWLPASTSA